MSDQDIKAGTNWSERIKKELANTTVGVVCMTPENQDAKWINYEMGALSKEVNDGETRVIPLLIGFGSTSEVGQPAASLNMVMLGQQGFKDIATSINDIVDSKREKAQLDEVSDVWWSLLGPKMTDAAAQAPAAEPAPPSDRELAEEILAEVRALKRAETAKLSPYTNLTGGSKVYRHEEEIDQQKARKTGRIRVLNIVRQLGYPEAKMWSGSTRATIKTANPVIPEIQDQVRKEIYLTHPESFEVNFELFDSEREV